MGKKLLVLLVAVAMVLSMSGLAAANLDSYAGIQGNGVEDEGINGAEEEESGKPELGRRHPFKDKQIGPPVFVKEMLQQKFTVISQERVKINGGPFQSDLPPVIKEGRTLIPVRAVTRGMGAAVEWDSDEKKVTITKGDVVIEIYLNDSTYFVNGEPMELDMPAQMLSNRVFVPLRFIAEALGARVNYNQEMGIEITSDVDLEEEEEEEEEEE